MIISYFSHRGDNDPAHSEVTWEVLAHSLSEVRTAQCTLETCKRSECVHKDGPSWSAARYRDGAKRGLSGVVDVHALIVDVDHVAPEGLDDFIVNILPYRCIITSSHSDREKDRCLRIVLDISRPVLAGEWYRFWQQALLELGIPGDTQTRDPSRLFFLPSRPSDACGPEIDGNGYTFIQNEGAQLDVDAILARAPESTSYEIDAEFEIPEFTGAPSQNNLEIAINSLAGAWPDAGRNTCQLALCGALARAGWPVELITDFVETVCELAHPGNGDRQKRAKAARASVAKVQSGEMVAGWPTVEEYVDPDAVRVAMDALGMGGPKFDQGFVDALKVHAQPANNVVTVSRDDIQSTLEAARKRLRRSSNPKKITEGKLIGRALDGKSFTEHADDDADMAFRAAVQAITRHAPRGASTLILAEYLAKSRPDVGVDALCQMVDEARSRNTIEHKAELPPDEFVLEFNGPRMGKPVASSQHNFGVALRRLNVEFYYDAFARRKLMEKKIDDTLYREVVEDSTVDDIMFEIERQFDFFPPKDKFYSYCGVTARMNSFHPVVDYLDGLPAWDGETRSDTWLIKYGGAPDTPYVRAVSRLVLTAAVRRVRAPGSKFDEMLILESPQGSGKCLGRGTRVLMFDGSIKAVEDVRPGDLLMGPDSTPRTVLGTTKGVGQLKMIKPTKGDAWVCNDQHVLTVALHGDEPVVNGQRVKLKDYIDAPVTDFVPHKWGSRHAPSNKYAMQVRAPEVRFHKQNVPLEPYLLGLWLGDGTCKVPEITNIEPEILKYCVDIAPTYGIECKIRLSNNNCPKAVFSGKSRTDDSPQQYTRGNPNPVMSAFRACIVNDEKRIPKNYLINDTETRLQLLAGLIDTDGSLANNTYKITTKWAGLRDDILFLARSLGMAAYSSEFVGCINSLDFSGVYHGINISGNIDVIPVKVPRKIASPRRQVKDVLRTGFRVEDIGVGEYFGFELDGDSRFLLSDFTITHNSSAIKTLCPNPDWFADNFQLNGDTKKMIEQTQGKWIVEAGELRGMSAHDQNTLKAYLSSTCDEARMAYAREPQRMPRQFIIIGTTNDTQYLKDHTGDRRYWPVKVKVFDIEGLAAIRDQLWAEAYYLELTNPDASFIRLDPSLYAEAAVEQASRKVDNAIKIILEDKLGNITGRIKVSDTWRIVTEDVAPSNALMTTIASAMHELGWAKERIRVNGQRVYYYMKGTEEERAKQLIVHGNLSFGITLKSVDTDTEGNPILDNSGKPLTAN